jgi:aminoglycoside N3'-acetyltransferase
MNITQADVRCAVLALGLEHSPVCLHTSLRSFGPLEGGLMAVVQAFLEADCTLLVPTFSYEAFAIAPPTGLQFANNGYDYSYRTSRPPSTQNVYTPRVTELDEDMGALPAAVLAMPEHFRGDHPLNSFSAVGPQAQKLVEAQNPAHVYAPLELLSELGGFVVLAGVGLNRMTVLHLAEQRAGRTPFRRWAQDREGNPMAAEVGGCSEGFEKLAPILAPYVQRTQVGTSRWQAFQASRVVKVVAKAIRAMPDITHCDNPGCERCHDAISGGPILT